MNHSPCFGPKSNRHWRYGRKACFALPALLLALAALLSLPLPVMAQGKGEPGRFDYYVLALSWSPQHCSSNAEPDQRQCGPHRRYGFIAHGLWPQYGAGGYPEFCRSGPGPSRETIDAIIEIMPSERLVRHQWTKHGTCSGLTADRYFDATSRAFASVVLPEFYRQPTGSLSRTVERLKREFVAANPRLRAESIAVLCSGQYLREVRICLDRALQPRACGRDSGRSTCRAAFIVRPVR